MAEPVSRFWACLSASSIFALFWTQKMKKTRRWLLVFIPLCLVSRFTWTASMQSLQYSDRLDSESSLPAFMLFDVPSISIVAAVIYLMFRWTTKYNLDNFGARSKKEWARQNRVPDKQD